MISCSSKSPKHIRSLNPQLCDITAKGGPNMLDSVNFFRSLGRYLCYNTAMASQIKTIFIITTVRIPAILKIPGLLPKSAFLSCTMKVFPLFSAQCLSKESCHLHDPYCSFCYQGNPALTKQYLSENFCSLRDPNTQCWCERSWERCRRCFVRLPVLQHIVGTGIKLHYEWYFNGTFNKKSAWKHEAFLLSIVLKKSIENIFAERYPHAYNIVSTVINDLCTLLQFIPNERR